MTPDQTVTLVDFYSFREKLLRISPENVLSINKRLNFDEQACEATLGRGSKTLWTDTIVD